MLLRCAQLCAALLQAPCTCAQCMAATCLPAQLHPIHLADLLPTPAEDDSYVSYLEGCTAPAYDTNQLHAAVVELSAGKNAEIKYSTVRGLLAGACELHAAC